MARANAEIDRCLNAVAAEAAGAKERQLRLQIYQSYRWHGVAWKDLYKGCRLGIPLGYLLFTGIAVILGVTKVASPWVLLVGWVNVVLFLATAWIVSVMVESRIRSDCAKVVGVLRVLEG